MVIFIRAEDGRVIRRSRNLRGIVDWARFAGVACLSIRPAPDNPAEGILIVWFVGGTYCVTRFASWEVLKGYIARTRWHRGAPVEVGS